MEYLEKFRPDYLIEYVTQNVVMVPLLPADAKRAVAVGILLPNGNRWLGVFRFGGYLDTFQVLTCPDPRMLCVRAGERVSLVDVFSAANYEEIRYNDILQVVASAELGLLLFASETEIVAYDATGLKWMSGCIAADGLRVVSIDAERALIVASRFNPALNADEAVRLSAVSGEVLT